MTTLNKNTSKKISDNIMEFKGKTFTKTGRLTKKFKTFALENPSVLIPSQFVRVGDKFILKSKAFDKRFKSNVLKKKFSKPKKVFLKGDFEKVYEPRFFNNGEYKGVPINDDSFLFKTYKKISSGGDMVRVIVKAYDYDNDSINNIQDLQSKKKSDILYNNTNVIIDNQILTQSNMYDYRQEGQEFILFIDSNYPNVIAYLLANNLKVRLILSKMENLTPQQINQNFREGTDHCLLNPILLWANDLMSKSKKSSYKTIYNKLNGKTLKNKKTIGYIEKFKDGIPETELDNLCEDLQIKIVVKYPLKQDKYKSWTSTKKPLKKFMYVNTRLDHVDYITTFDNKDLVDDDLTHEDLQNKFNELVNDKTYFIFGRLKTGISWIQTLNKIYRLKDEYNQVANDFINDINFNKYKIDAIKEKDKTKFIRNGTHFNGTTDFLPLGDVDDDDIEHIDMKKAYSQFHKSKYYKGMCGSMTDLRYVDNYDQPGLYYIIDLDLSEANEKFNYYNSFMCWYSNNNIYTDAELRFLNDMGGKFKVKCGCYGFTMDFKFNDDMLNKKQFIKRVNNKDIKISFYAKFIGKCASINYHSKINMLGSKDYFSNLQDNHNDIRYDDHRNEATILYPKNQVFHYSHISAQVIAYQRLNLMEQLLQMEHDKIIRVCVDGIYYYSHKCKINDIFQDKKNEKTFNNSPTETYLSNIFKPNKVDLFFNDIDESYKNPIDGIIFGDKRDFYKNELIKGAGGNGKSYMNLTDNGHTNALYISPSWKLARDAQNKIDSGGKYCKYTKVSVIHRYLYMEFEDNLQRDYNVVYVDEVSQLTEHQKNKLFSIKNTKFIFMGDIGYQLEPIIDYKDLKKFHIKLLQKVENTEKDFIKWINDEGHYEIKESGFDNIIELTNDYRAICPRLKRLKKNLRMFIDKGRYSKKDERLQIRNEALEFSNTKIKTITDDELIKIYVKSNMILASKHEIIKKYNKMFSHIPKYLVSGKSKYHSTGDVIYEKLENLKVKKYDDEDIDVNHCFTCHQIQGETLQLGEKLFINTTELFSDRMLYTAISRARTLDQIYFI